MKNSFDNCTHYFFYSEKQDERQKEFIWHHMESPTYFKGHPYTEMREIGKGWPDWDDAVYLGAGTFLDIQHNIDRSGAPRVSCFDGINQYAVPKLVGVGIGCQFYPQFKTHAEIMAERVRQYQERLDAGIEQVNRERYTTALIEIMNKYIEAHCGMILGMPITAKSIYEKIVKPLINKL